MFRSLQLPLVLSLLAMLAAPVLAGAGSGPGAGMGGPGSGTGGGPGGQRLERMFAEANLEPGTEAKVRAIINEARRAHRPQREQVAAARRALNDLLEADPPDAAAVLAQADAIGVLIAQAQRMRAATLLQVRSVVTADEWRQLRRGLDAALEPQGRGRGRGPRPGAE